MQVIDQVIKKGEYSIYNADTVEVAKALDSDSVDFSIFSPPFASLYTYSNSDRDMGNVKSDDEFWEQYRYLIKEQFRVMKPGRNIAIHCMNLPTSKQNDGYIGIKDFRGDIIREYQKEGFIYHSEVCIWKNPVTAMTRTKALGLLHKTIKKDSAMSRMGIPDYIVVMRKPGENTRPVAGEFQYYVGDEPPAGFTMHERNDGSFFCKPGEGNTSIDVWQKYASPIWDDIKETDTLNFREGRDSDDERHICPLQLDVIERCLQLWSIPGDVVWTPFMGIGSEVYMSLKLGRKAIGAELKPSYFALAKRNIANANDKQYEMF
jgi:DNA modification methylase